MDHYKKCTKDITKEEIKKKLQGKCKEEFRWEGEEDAEEGNCVKFVEN